MAVRAVALGKKLSLVGIGRSLQTGAKAKNNIKCADRLLGNTKLHGERNEIYKIVSFSSIGNKKKPPIIIDWSAASDVKHYILRAAMPTKGRSITLYEEVHHQKKLGNHRVHKQFLKILKATIPADCKAIIMTDAGFHSPFFKEVEKLGWDWVGRIRNLTKYKVFGLKLWISCKELYKKATKTPQYFSEVILSKSTPIQCFLFIYKGKKKGRIAKNKQGKRRKAKDSKKHAQCNKEPWVLATSLKGGTRIAKKVVWLYKLRMQIEEGFRDIKNSRLGLSFEEAQTYKPERLEILLLIGMLAVLALHILGKVGEQRRMQFDFQANTTKNRTVLSLFFLGGQMIKQEDQEFTNQELLMALVLLSSKISPGLEV